MVEVKTGDLLIAPPSMPDPRFNQSVMFITHYNSRGAYALCMNKPTEHTLNTIVEPLGLKFKIDHPLYWGGPVSLSTVWMLHDSDWSEQYHAYQRSMEHYQP